MKISKKRTRKEALDDSDSEFEEDKDDKPKSKAGSKRARVSKSKENHEETKEPAHKEKVDKIVSDYKWKVHPSPRNVP